MTGYIFDPMETHDYENLFFCQEKALGLKAIIAIHDTTLGPAAGGVRMMPYETEAESIEDVMRLGGILSGLDSLNPGGFNRQRAMEKVAHIYDTVERVIAIAKEQHIPTYRAANVLAEQRIASVRQAKSVAITSDWKI